MSEIGQATAFDSLGPLAKARLKEAEEEMGLHFESDRMIRSQIIRPIQLCAEKGYSDEFIGQASIEELCYAAEFGGRPVEFAGFMESNGILGMRDPNLAMELVRRKVSREEYLLRDIPNYGEYGRAPNGIDQVDFVRRVACMPPEEWYVAAISKMSQQEFEDVRSYGGNPLVRLAFCDVWDRLRDPSADVQWAVVYRGSSIIAVPLYQWKIFHAIEVESPMFVYETGNAVCVCDRYPDIKLNLPQIKTFGSGEFPVESFLQSKLRILGCRIEYELTELYQRIMPAIMNLVYGYKDWLIYLRYYDLFNSLCVRWNASFALSLVLRDGGRITVDPGISTGEAIVEGERINVYEYALCKRQFVGSVVVGNKEINKEQLHDYIGSVDKWLREAADDGN